MVENKEHIDLPHEQTLVLLATWLEHLSQFPQGVKESHFPIQNTICKVCRKRWMPWHYCSSFFASTPSSTKKTKI